MPDSALLAGPFLYMLTATSINDRILPRSGKIISARPRGAYFCITYWESGSTIKVYYNNEGREVFVTIHQCRWCLRPAYWLERLLQEIL